MEREVLRYVLFATTLQYLAMIAYPHWHVGDCVTILPFFHSIIMNFLVFNNLPHLAMISIVSPSLHSVLIELSIMDYNIIHSPPLSISKTPLSKQCNFNLRYPPLCSKIRSPNLIQILSPPPTKQPTPINPSRILRNTPSPSDRTTNPN